MLVGLLLVYLPLYDQQQQAGRQGIIMVWSGCKPQPEGLGLGAVWRGCMGLLLALPTTVQPGSATARSSSGLRSY
jgi:hypothetical protein